jgi:hypothetical protein
LSRAGKHGGTQEEVSAGDIAHSANDGIT